MGKLENKVAIVTGGGTGIGRAIALTFAREGASVVVCGRNKANLEPVAREIRALGRRSLAVAVDVAVKTQVQSMVKQAVDEFGRIDILVNNAGIISHSLITDMTEEAWDSVVDTDLKGEFLCTQAVAPYMQKQRYGKIVNISSLAAIRPGRSTVSAYGAAKAGVQNLTESEALEFGPYGINVNCIAPGMVETSITKGGATSEAAVKYLVDAKRVPARRLGEPQDIANVALFLASEDSSFVCGASITVDGGRNATNQFI